MKKTRRYTTGWKGHQIDWDFVSTRPDDLTCYRLSKKQVAILLAFTEYIGWKTRWFSPTGAVISQDQIDAWQSAIETALMLPEDCGGEGGCSEFLPNSPIITYAPNDPFLTPNYLPEGYSVIPWYTNAPVPLPGVLPTDAMVNGLSIIGPSVPIPHGFPRFRVHCYGSGEVEIELVKIPIGGLALITIDGDPLTALLVTLDTISLDMVSITGILSALGIGDAGLVQTAVVELEIATPGAHYVDVTFLPNFGGETLIGFGGGLRRVSLCGPSQPGEVDFMFRLRQNEDIPCHLEQSFDAGETWSLAFDYARCQPQQAALYQTYQAGATVVDRLRQQTYDGTPQSIHPSAPAAQQTFAQNGVEYDSLCAAVMAWTAFRMVDNLRAAGLTMALSAAVTGLLAALTGGLSLIIGGGLVTGIAGVSYAELESACEDEDAVKEAACTLYDSLKDIECTHENFQSALAGLPSTGTGNLAIIYPVLKQHGNLWSYLHLIELMGEANQQNLANCPCDDGCEDCDLQTQSTLIEVRCTSSMVTPVQTETYDNGGEWGVFCYQRVPVTIDLGAEYCIKRLDCIFYSNLSGTDNPETVTITTGSVVYNMPYRQRGGGGYFRDEQYFEPLQKARYITIDPHVSGSEYFYWGWLRVLVCPQGE